MKKLSIFHLGYILSESFDVIILGYLALKFSNNTNEVLKVFSSGFIVRSLLIYFSGYIIDKYNKKSILFYSSLVRAISLIFAAIISFLGLINIFTLSLLSILLMGSKQFYSTAMRTLVKLISKKNVSSSHSLLNIMANTAGILSPIIAGFFLKFNLESYLFILASTINILILFPLLKLKYQEQNKRKVVIVKIHKEFIKTFKYIKKTGAIFYWFIMAFFIFGLFVRNAVFVGFLNEQFHSSPIYMSIFFGISCAGAIVGSVLMNKYLKKWFDLKNILLFGTLFHGVFSILFVYSPNIFVAFINIFIVSLSFVLWIEFQSIAQYRTKKEHLAKASSMTQFLSFTISVILLETSYHIQISFTKILFILALIYIVLSVVIFFYFIKYKISNHHLQS